MDQDHLCGCPGAVLTFTPIPMVGRVAPLDVVPPAYRNWDLFVFTARHSNLGHEIWAAGSAGLLGVP